jgi:hypothetical protein
LPASLDAGAGASIVRCCRTLTGRRSVGNHRLVVFILPLINLALRGKAASRVAAAKSKRFMVIQR